MARGWALAHPAGLKCGTFEQLFGTWGREFDHQNQKFQMPGELPPPGGCWGYKLIGALWTSSKFYYVIFRAKVKRRETYCLTKRDVPCHQTRKTSALVLDNWNASAGSKLSGIERPIGFDDGSHVTSTKVVHDNLLWSAELIFGARGKFDFELWIKTINPIILVIGRDSTLARDFFHLCTILTKYNTKVTQHNRLFFLPIIIFQSRFSSSAWYNSFRQWHFPSGIKMYVESDQNRPILKSYNAPASDLLFAGFTMFYLLRLLGISLNY